MLAQFFIVTKRTSDRHHFCKKKFLCIVSSAGGSFCWNYVYSNYAGDNNYYSYVGGSFCCNHACDCFCCNYSVRSFCSTYESDGLFIYFNLFLQMGVSVAIMQVVLSAVHNSFYCKMQVTVSVKLYRWHFQVTILYSFL